MYRIHVPRVDGGSIMLLTIVLLCCRDPANMSFLLGLQEVARHRSMQRLVAEARDLLSESEATHTGDPQADPMLITNG